MDRREASMLEVYSFDPGLVTGFARVMVIDGEVASWNVRQMDHFGVGEWMDAFIHMEKTNPNPNIERVIVYEKFVMTAKKSQSPWSLEAIGLLRYASLQTGCHLEGQTPAAAKSLIRDEVIKSLDMWVPGQGHSMDGLRHALYYLVTKRKELRECLKADAG